MSDAGRRKPCGKAEGRGPGPRRGPAASEAIEGSGPNPTLGSLDRLVGTWEKSDRGGTADGSTSFEWMESGYFLSQRVDFTVSEDTEIIGHDEESGNLRSHYFGNGGGILKYAYELEDDTLTASMDMPRTKGRFASTFYEDGNSLAGRWEWTEGGQEMAYDAVMIRTGES